MGWLSCLGVLFLLFSICSSSNSSFSITARHLCHPDESSALLQFKNSFSIDSSSYTEPFSWEKGKDCCTWSGVTCEKENGHVIGLDLASRALQGDFHSNSTLFFLRHLQRLDLSGNDFRGSPISSEFGGFVSMTHLDLSYSNFNGPIPSEISNLSNLVFLNLAFDSIQDTLRLDTLGLKRIAQNLTNLRELCLDSVELSSVVLDHSFMNLSSSLTSLQLQRCKLQGEFPESIFRLPKLQHLDLSYNYALTGSLPMSNWSSPLEFFDLSYTRISIDGNHLAKNLKSLRSVYLRNCTFVGSYPSFNSFGTPLFSLALLTELDLSGNNFVGQLPEVHANSTQISSFYDASKNHLVGHTSRHLIKIWLSDNSLNGAIPSWLASLPSLEDLALRSNQLSGNILEFQSSSLVRIDLSFNNLHGQIPRSIFELVNLDTLDLSSNNLSGVVQFEDFSKLQSLSHLSLSFNHLSLSFNNTSNYTWPELLSVGLSSCNISEFVPYFLRTSPKLSSLDLSNNQIQGDVPKWLWDAGKDSLYYLNLSHNFLTDVGQIPWENLEYLDLRSNFLQGELPIPPPSTYVFSISNNQLTGTLPSAICNLSSLQVLDLSNNSLSGEIPPCIGNFSQSLSVLDLSKNKLLGTIPATFSKGNILRNLDLNGNQLEGTLPQSLLTCTKLEVLNLGNNKIYDIFPSWLESLPLLQVLALRSNKFHGPIVDPKTTFPFQNLRIMDLSDNQLSGLLPAKCVENLTAMMNLQERELKYMGEEYYQDTVVVSMKGLDIELVKIQTFFTTIDFSSNKFIGEIPNEIGKLKALKGLNFSHNELTGPIPPSFGTLINLEWLDISSNKLAGKIPMQLVDLTYLAKLNLSENQLVGPIPHGNQFNTFDNDSYAGNVGLCGYPLSKTCNPNKPPNSSFQQEHDSEHVNGFDWKIVLMGYACGLVIGISMGYLVLSSTKRDWLVNLVGRKKWRKRWLKSGV